MRDLLHCASSGLFIATNIDDIIILSFFGEAKDNGTTAVSCWDNISDSSAFSGLPCLRPRRPSCYLTKCCLILA